jgi:DNA-binding NtrC family response regulator
VAIKLVYPPRPHRLGDPFERVNIPLGMLKRVLLVEPHRATSSRLEDALRWVARVDYCVDFDTARVQVRQQSYDLLVTNLRLREYNGLHLIYLAVEADLNIRCLVYGDPLDLGLAHEVQRIGAFCESTASIPHALLGYLQGQLPARDRRNPVMLDRRSPFQLRRHRRRADVLSTNGDGDRRAFA